MELNIEKAKVVAKLYIERKWNPLDSKGQFDFYYVRVGEDLNHKPETIYAESLPNEFAINNDKVAKEIFYSQIPNDDYLLKVIVNKEENILDVKIISKPNK